MYMFQNYHFIQFVATCLYNTLMQKLWNNIVHWLMRNCTANRYYSSHLFRFRKLVRNIFESGRTIFMSLAKATCTFLDSLDPSNKGCENLSRCSVNSMQCWSNFKWHLCTLWVTNFILYYQFYCLQLSIIVV